MVYDISRTVNVYVFVLAQCHGDGVDGKANCETSFVQSSIVYGRGQTNVHHRNDMVRAAIGVAGIITGGGARYINVRRVTEFTEKVTEKLAQRLGRLQLLFKK